MESPRPDEDRSAAPQQQQQDVPLEAEDTTSVPLDYVPPPEDRGEDVPLDVPPDYVPGVEDPTDLPEDDNPEGYIPDYSWLDNASEPMHENVAEDVVPTPEPYVSTTDLGAEDVVAFPEPGAEDSADVPLDYVPPAEDRGEDVPLDYVPGNDLWEESTDSSTPVYQEPDQVAQDLAQPLGDGPGFEGVVEAPGDVDWESGVNSLNEGLEGFNDAIRHGGLMGPGMAGEFGDQADELGYNLAEGNWEQANDNVEGMVDEVAKGYLGEFVGDEGADRVVGAARDIQDTIGEAQTNLVADVAEGNWEQAYDDYQGAVDSVATSTLGAAFGDEAGESIVQGYHDVQDTVSELGAEAVEGVADAMGDVFDW